ncbi:hypothetical protein Y032_0128g1443 [Ancylostoma ceylanicum]|uniref:7TM GPCR serpentine receptor class x (Srx) domain-containing protein n=1 Tax=Ancylostoma ceylanicum TaxID=53326 RepID=A0A016T843_9BILA|nr:hypothetical protein Y032_0128g1443 [Ancylostoma ceylanicum]
MRSIIALYANIYGSVDVYVLVHEIWFYEIEIMASLSMWVQLIVNKNIRSYIFNRNRRSNTAFMSTVSKQIDS